MRTFGVVVAGGIVSYGVAIVAAGIAMLLGLVAQPGPHQQFEIVAVLAGEAAVAIGTAIVLAIVLIAGGRRTAVRRTAIVLAVLFAAALLAPLAIGLATQDSADVMARDEMVQLGIFLAAIGVPGLLAIGTQAWFVGRRLSGPAAAPKA